MIKFFRRIRQRLLQQNQVNKYLLYAIGEILLVVLGILIALQINNWNSDLKAQKEEQVLLKNLHSEFLDVKEQFEARQRYHKNVIMPMGYLLKALEAEQIPPSSIDTIYTYLTRAGVGNTAFKPSQGILNSIINSGQLNLIQNEALKLRLMQWNDELNLYHMVEESTLNIKFTYLYPLIAQMVQFPPKDRPNLYMQAIAKGEVVLERFQAKEFYNYLSQCWITGQMILAQESPFPEFTYKTTGTMLQEAIEHILEQLEEEIEG